MNDAEENSPSCNAKMKLISHKFPRLCLFAKRDILPNEEIRYDYGEESSKLPWRNKVLFGVNKIISFVPFMLRGKYGKQSTVSECLDG